MAQLDLRWVSDRDRRYDQTDGMGSRPAEGRIEHAPVR
jgi:hypothetical protein